MKKNSRKVVVITGASAGLGRATALKFARDGARIGLIARDQERLQAVKREAEILGGEAIILPADVSDWQAVDEAAAKVEKVFGPIDVWINDAMVSVFSPVKEMLPEEYRRVTEVTYLGYVHGTLAALHRMLPRNRGVILQVGSALALRSIPLQSAYCAAKHAIYGFTESLRVELIHDKSNVRVTMVEMPAMNTPQFEWVKSRLKGRAQPVPPIYQPELAAEAIFYAANHKRRDVKLGFSTLKAVIAEKLSPGFADWWLSRTGYRSQQTSEPENPARPSNLYVPVKGSYGAHGRFDAKARAFSWEWWMESRYPFVLSMVTLAALGIVDFFRGRLRLQREIRTNEELEMGQKVA